MAAFSENCGAQWDQAAVQIESDLASDEEYATYLMIHVGEREMENSARPRDALEAWAFVHV